VSWLKLQGRVTAISGRSRMAELARPREMRPGSAELPTLPRLRSGAKLARGRNQEMSQSMTNFNRPRRRPVADRYTDRYERDMSYPSSPAKDVESPGDAPGAWGLNGVTLSPTHKVERLAVENAELKSTIKSLEGAMVRSMQRGGNRFISGGQFRGVQKQSANHDTEDLQALRDIVKKQRDRIQELCGRLRGPTVVSVGVVTEEEVKEDASAEGTASTGTGGDRELEDRIAQLEQELRACQDQRDQLDAQLDQERKASFALRTQAEQDRETIAALQASLGAHEDKARKAAARVTDARATSTKALMQLAAGEDSVLLRACLTQWHTQALLGAKEKRFAAERAETARARQAEVAAFRSSLEQADARAETYAQQLEIEVRAGATRSAEQSAQDKELQLAKQKAAELQQAQREADAARAQADAQRALADEARAREARRAQDSAAAQLRAEERARQDQERAKELEAQLLDERRKGEVVDTIERAINKLGETRLLVTAPKVSIRVGDEMLDLEPHQFPLAQVKDVIEREILPQFTRLCAITGEVPENSIHQRLHTAVDELARTVTAKLQELLPRADVREPRARTSSNTGPRRRTTREGA